MATLATLTVDVDSDVSKLQSSLAGAQSKLKSFSTAAVRAGTSLTKGLTLPIVGIGVVAVKSFTDAEQVQAQTQAALRSTGAAANLTAGQISGLAGKLSALSGVDDEAIQSGENLLLTFTNIRNEAGKGNDVFNQTAKAALDLSVAMGTDMKSAAMQVGKALNDPIRGLSALTRVGVTFSEKQREQITAMVEAGNVMGAQKAILAELNTEFGGSAAAMGKTAEGAMNIAKVELGNAMEKIGKVIVEVVLPAFQKLVDWLQQGLSWFNNLSEGTKKWIVEGLALAAAVGPLLIVLGKLASAINIVIGVVRVLTIALSTNPYVAIIAATALLAIVIVKNWDTIKSFLLKAWDAIVDAAKWAWDHVAIFVLGPMKLAIDWLIDHWRGVKDTLVDVWHAIGDVFSNVWNGIVTVAKTAVNLIIGAINSLISGVNRAVDALDVALGPFVNFGNIGAIPKFAAGGIVTRPTVAMLGERGPEMVVPLGNMPLGGGRVNITINGWVGNDQDVAKRVRDELIKLGNRNAGTGLR